LLGFRTEEKYLPVLFDKMLYLNLAIITTVLQKLGFMFLRLSVGFYPC